MNKIFNRGSSKFVLPLSKLGGKKLDKDEIMRYIALATSKKNYSLAKAFASKPFQASKVEKIASENNGVLIGSSVLFNTDDKVINELIEGKKIDDFIIISNEEGLNTLYNFLEKRNLKEKKEKLIASQDIDTKIREVIKKYKPEETEENIKSILKLVKEAEKTSVNELKTKMGEVYKLRYNQGQTTEIFMANPNLKVDKNTFVVKRDLKEEK